MTRAAETAFERVQEVLAEVLAELTPADQVEVLEHLEADVEDRIDDLDFDGEFDSGGEG